MKFPLKSRERSEMEQFTLLLEQATNQLPSAGIIRAPPVRFHDCSATEIAGPGGQHSEWQRAAVPRFQPRLPKKQLSPEGLRVFRGSLRLCTRAGHSAQSEQPRAGPGSSICSARSAERLRSAPGHAAGPGRCGRGSRRGTASPCCSARCWLLGAPRVLSHAPVFPLPSA